MVVVDVVVIAVMVVVVIVIVVVVVATDPRAKVLTRFNFLLPEWPGRLARPNLKTRILLFVTDLNKRRHSSEIRNHYETNCTKRQAEKTSFAASLRPN